MPTFKAEMEKLTNSGIRKVIRHFSSYNLAQAVLYENDSVRDLVRQNMYEVNWQSVVTYIADFDRTLRYDPDAFRFSSKTVQGKIIKQIEDSITNGELVVGDIREVLIPAYVFHH